MWDANRYFNQTENAVKRDPKPEKDKDIFGRGFSAPEEPAPKPQHTKWHQIDDQCRGR